MKRFALYIEMAIMLVASCSIQEEDFEIPQQDEMVFYASFEQPSEDTRVYANEDLLLRWTADDRVSIFNKNTYNQQYKFTGQTGDNAGGFRKVDTDEFVTGNPISNVVSIYPYQEDTRITESGVISVLLPAEQRYAENTFGLGANTMVSVSEDNFLQYKNVGGYLRLSLYGKDVSVSSITLKGNNGEKLAGKATITMPLDGIPSATMANDATDEITLACNTPVVLGETAENCVDFWLVVPSITFSRGFSIIITSSSGNTFEKTTSNSITIGRSNVSKMAPFKVEIDVTPPDPSDFISFADVIAKYACVEKFDTNKDGEVSYGEAASVTNLNGLFADWNTVTSFNELQYFTSATSTAGVFNGLKNLESVTFPDNITNVGTFEGCIALKTIVLPQGLSSLSNRCFYGCSSLKTLTLPVNLTTIPSYSFAECSSLEEINLPMGITSIGDYAFYNCASLNSIVFPSTLTTIGSYAFYKCSLLPSINLENVVGLGYHSFEYCISLEEVCIPSGLSSWGGGVFKNCSGIKKATIEEGILSIPYDSFASCTNLSNLSLGNAIQTIEDKAFYDCPISEAVGATRVFHLPKSISYLGSQCFTNIHHLFIPSEQLIPIGEDAFALGMYLYVPSNLVEPYKVRTNWSKFKNYIFSIDSYPVESSSIVDLGLSVKWATCNVGAAKPEDFGGYYAWGEVEEKDWYDWSTYKWMGDNKKYNTEDNLLVLEECDDAASVVMGNGWRMPTYAELRELINNCKWEPISYFGVLGARVSSLVEGFTDNWIFIPAAGEKETFGGLEGNYHDVGTFIQLWSSTLCPSGWFGVSGAYHLDYRLIDKNFYTFSGMPEANRDMGMSIRAVHE